jgi:exonuclease III
MSGAMLEFINDKNPDILCIQEFSSSAAIDLKVYRHKYILMAGNQIKTGQAIFLSFPLLIKVILCFLILIIM